MTAQELLALLPIILISASAVAVMMLIALLRDYRLTVLSTMAGLIITLAALPMVASMAPIQVTPLLIIDQLDGIPQSPSFPIHQKSFGVDGLITHPLFPPPSILLLAVKLAPPLAELSLIAT